MSNIILYLKDLLFNTNYGEFIGFLLVILIVMGIVSLIIVNRLSAKHDTLDNEILVEKANENSLIFVYFFLFEAIAVIFGILSLLYILVWLFS